MSAANADDTVNGGTRGRSYEEYGCRVNAISPTELFRRYRAAGFLYPAKVRHVERFWSLNWRRALRGGELIHWVATYDDPDASAWASVSAWRSTHEGWHNQHLVSIGGPVASRAVMLAGQAVRIEDDRDHSHQNWFRPTNRFATKVFGSVERSLGPEVSSVLRYAYVHLPLEHVPSAPVRNVRVVASSETCEPLRLLVHAERGPTFAVAEEIDHPDLLLDEVDQLYSRVGLRRYRRVWLAYLGRSFEPVGACLAYRGPLGLNMSLLESRCDLVLASDLAPAVRSDVIVGLIRVAASEYEEHAPGMIPVVVDRRDAELLQLLGGRLRCHYDQSIWLREGFEGWYQHIQHVYDVAMRAEARRVRRQMAPEVAP